jgi:hypothetical protein
MRGLAVAHTTGPHRDAAGRFNRTDRGSRQAAVQALLTVK